MASGRFEKERKKREAAALRQSTREEQYLRELSARNPNVIVMEEDYGVGPMGEAERLQDCFEEVDSEIGEEVRHEEEKGRTKKRKTGHIGVAGLAGDPEASIAATPEIQTGEVVCPICQEMAGDVGMWSIRGLKFNRLYTTPPRAECCGRCAGDIEEGRIDIVGRFEPGTVMVVGPFRLEPLEDIPQARKGPDEVLRERLLRSAPHRVEQVPVGDSTASPEMMLRKMLGR